MQLFIRIILGLFLFALPVKAEETKEDICIYVTVKEGNTYKVTKLGNCSEYSNTIIYTNQNKETI